MVRDEFVSASKSVETDYQQESLQRILKDEGRSSDLGKNVSDFKERVFEIILTFGRSFSGHSMATNLAKAKISTTVITDTSIFAMMAR